MTILENSSIPNVEVALLENSDSSSINTSEFFSSGKFVLVGVPGAFTPTCHLQHFPGYVESNQAFLDKGYKVVFMSVNDPFVMNAWGKEHKVEDKIIMMGDPFLNFTKSIGADVDKSARGLGIRSNRYTMLIDDLKVVKLQEEDDTGACEISAAENFLKLV